MRFFLAGIMQGSYAEALLHDQDYRQRIGRLIARSFPDAEVYDPLANHADSITYTDEDGRRVFFMHNEMCREVDVLVAFLPEASMGTAIEMWEAYQHGAAVFAVSPMIHNWAVKFLSHAVFPTLEDFEAELTSGRMAQRIGQICRNRPT